MKNLKDKIKGKVAAKIAKGKAKIAAKCGGKPARACAALALACASLAALLAGCGTVTPSRSQSLAISDCTINIYGSGKGTTNDVARVEIASQAMQVETSGTETQTATPQYTTDVRPDIDVEVPVSKSGAAQSVGSTLGDAAAGLVKGLTSGDGGTTNDTASAAK